MEKKGEYSRGVNYLIVLAFLVLLTAIIVIANTGLESSSSGYIAKEISDANTDFSIDGRCCSGYCKIGYTFGTNTRAQTRECSFSAKRAPGCTCDIPEVPADAKILGNPTCTVQYHSCKK